MRVKDYMVTDVFTCKSHDSLAYAASLLLHHDCGCLPVVDNDGRVGAVITDRDICMAAFLEGKPLGDLQVMGSMSRKLVTCRPDDTLVAAAKKMQDTQVRRLPVVDEQNKVVGLLSLNDIALAVKPEMVKTLKDEAALATLLAMAGVCKHRTNVPVASTGGGEVKVAVKPGKTKEA